MRVVVAMDMADGKRNKYTLRHGKGSNEWMKEWPNKSCPSCHYFTVLLFACTVGLELKMQGCGGLNDSSFGPQLLEPFQTVPKCNRNAEPNHSPATHPAGSSSRTGILMRPLIQPDQLWLLSSYNEMLYLNCVYGCKMPWKVVVIHRLIKIS